MPGGYESAVAIFAPQFGNYLRPTLVMVNLVLVNPMSNFTMIAVWAGAGFVGGLMAGTKKGAFVVGLMAWFSCLGLLVVFGILVFQGAMALGSFIVPPGSSLVDILGIPLIQGVIDQVLPLISGLFSGGGGLDFNTILTLLVPLLIWFLTPVIVVTIAAIVGAVVRPKEEF